jgi:hypothetical protein
MPAGRRRSAMRASDADRDRVLTELGEHFQAGRLTTDEMQERTGKALAAKTTGDLGDLMSDLPELHPAMPAPPARPASLPVLAAPPAVRYRRLPAVAGAAAVLAMVAVLLLAAQAGHHIVGPVALAPAVIVLWMLARGRRGSAGRRR